MHSAVQTAVVAIISYKPLSGLNFARYTGQYGIDIIDYVNVYVVYNIYEYGSYMPSSPLGVYKPLV